MNFKLLVLIFVVIGIESIDSSIIKDQSIDKIVKIGNLGVKTVGLFQEDDRENNPLRYIKHLSFNESDIVEFYDIEYPALSCKDFQLHKNNYCAIGNGKYRATFAECENIHYMDMNHIPVFDCKLFGARWSNKNVKFNGHKSIYTIVCKLPVTEEDSKDKCVLTYSFDDSESFDESDDVKNEL